MAKRSDFEILKSALIKLSDGKDQPILNSAIWSAIGWDKERFFKAREKLINSNIVTYEGHYTKFLDFLSHGLGEAKYKLFISYSHFDENYKDELLKHLSPLVHLNLIQPWHDRDMKAGDNINTEILEQLENSNLIILLISADFLNSEYCYHKEMKKAIDRHNNKSAILIPLIIRDCYWDHAPFKEILAATKDAKSIASYANRDQAFTEAVKKIYASLK